MLKQLTPFRQGVLIAVGGVILVIQCLNAPFINYDDELHVYGNQLVMRDDVTVAELFKPNAYTYMPLTLVSYRIDRCLFQSWLPHASSSGSWAPGVRFMTGAELAAMTLASGMAPEPDPIAQHQATLSVTPYRGDLAVKPI